MADVDLSEHSPGVYAIIADDTMEYANDVEFWQELVRRSYIEPISSPESLPSFNQRTKRLLRDSLPDLSPLPISFDIGYSGEDMYGIRGVRVTCVDGIVNYSLNSRSIGHIVKSLDQSKAGRVRALWRIFCSHVQLSLFFKDYACWRDGTPVYMDYGDAPSTNKAVLAYSSNRKNHTLVIDPFFLISNGYERLKDAMLSRRGIFPEKIDKIFWRGAASGVKGGDFLSSQRYNLCRVSRESRHASLIDVGLVNVPATYLNQVINRFGTLPDFVLPRPRVPLDTFSKYRYVIDVDGNSNSWGGLFTKMLSGSYIIKIDSAGQYRQWYYQSLERRGLISRVTRSLSDFDDVVTNVLQQDILAKSGAVENLFEFAYSMHPGPEIKKNNLAIHEHMMAAAE